MSFGLWVHHMFATGIPGLSLAFFSAGSMAVSVPSAIQVFAWISTFAAGRVRFHTPALFILGFLFIFVLGGLTGVMIALVPFDLQAHDTYFIVAHLHYVLFGGMVFPLFAGFYYWLPMVSRKRLSERLGRWIFGLMFIGFNVAFLPMHVTGLAGMPRRVYTYAEGLGWDALNLVSTVGAAILAAGIALFVVDLARSFRFSVDEHTGNVWDAPTLEWLPSASYGTRSIPIVTSREPLWDQPELANEVQAGAYYLPGTLTGRRETIVSAPLDAAPQYLLQLPGPSWRPIGGAVFTAAFFLLLTFKLVPIAVACGVIAVGVIIAWLWQTDPPLQPRVDIGGGVELPVNATGPTSHSWWAAIILLMVAASIDASLVFSCLYLWLVSPAAWPSPDRLPPVAIALAAAALLCVASGAIAYAGRALRDDARLGMSAGIVLALAALGAAFGLDLHAQRAAGVSPDESSHGAAVFALIALQGLYVAFVTVMGAYAIARAVTGRLDHCRRATFDSTRLLAHYTAAQGIVGLIVVHGFPRLVA